MEKKSTEKEDILLGRHLFFDRRLSVNNTRACATCHNPQFAFTDGYRRSLGVYADLHLRNTQPLFNLSYLKFFTAADSSIQSPLQQIDLPLFASHPTEMGVAGHESDILQRIAADKNYSRLFKDAGKEVSWQNIKLAIVEFINSIESFNAPYDRFVNGNDASLDSLGLKGKALFFSNELKCHMCHGGKNFSQPVAALPPDETSYFFNIGFGTGESDSGLYRLTKNENDIGKFRVPTLRNLAFTAPYYHDGSAQTLAEVLDDFSYKKRHHRYAINGAGTETRAFTENEKIYLLAFLLSLSDSSLARNPAYKNPFEEDETANSINLQQ